MVGCFVEKVVSVSLLFPLCIITPARWRMALIFFGCFVENVGVFLPFPSLYCRMEVPAGWYDSMQQHLMMYPFHFSETPTCLLAPGYHYPKGREKKKMNVSHNVTHIYFATRSSVVRNEQASCLSNSQQLRT